MLRVEVLICSVEVLRRNFLSFYSPSIFLYAYAPPSKLPFVAVFKGYHHHYREAREAGKQHTCVELKRPFTRLNTKCCVQDNPQKKVTNRERVEAPSYVKSVSYFRVKPAWISSKSVRQHFRSSSVSISDGKGQITIQMLGQSLV